MMGDGLRMGRRARIVKTERARALRRELTNAERILWEALRGRQFHGLRFRRQEPLAGFIVDFICFERKLVIEVDGAAHRDTQSYDQERDSILRARGLTVVRVTNDEIEQRLSDSLARIAHNCALPTRPDDFT